MTGFAAAARDESDGRVQVTLRAVNHRFLDLLVKAPAALGEAEARVRAKLQQRLTRGRVEASISVETTAEPVPDVTLNEALLDRIAAALETARERGLVSGTLTAADVVRVPHLLEIRPRGGDRAATTIAPELAALLDLTLDEAIDALVKMRETEGGFLATDLTTRLGTLRGFVDDLERLSHDGQRTVEARLNERLAGLTIDAQADPALLAQEIVRFVARSDVDEEVVRLRGHFDHWRLLAEGPEPCGRKLDFLVQEINRELNTIGAKIEGGRATETVIAAKAELERVREQVQNVE